MGIYAVGCILLMAIVLDISNTPKHSRRGTEKFSFEIESPDEVQVIA